ncbi:(Dimethylallyl)adenosine tRNA methylthiotransferase MiaB [Rickettsiales bacterium Ac37b]|nr:(Dimethylallyl)adenosine tRNA methylthiotransferase MiaB [Rickettsiales bacterium Ac37b]
MVWDDEVFKGINMNEVITFGCRLNIYESEVIKQQLNIANAEDVIVINSCAVTKEAERQVKQTIRKLSRKHTNKKIIVTGCAAQLHPEDFASMPEVYRVIGNEQKFIGEHYRTDQEITPKIIVNDIMSLTETASHMVQSFEGKARAFIQIQNGCNHRCTFCIIPYARGNSRSVPIGVITSQVKLLIEAGYQEIVFTGVDLTDYGKDLPGSPSLAQMIRRVLNLVPELSRLRLSSIDVAEIDQELFELITGEERLMPHIHISAQAGDDMILKRMKRRHRRADLISFCKNVRARRPNVAFGADLIAGFPTETEEMFTNTLNFISEAGLQYLHVFPYSERDGTPAARMPQVDLPVRKERAAKLRDAGAKELSSFLKKQLNSFVKVIAEKEHLGRTENFSVVEFTEEVIPGNVINSHIIAYTNDKLIAEVVA